MGLLEKVFPWLGHGRYEASPTAVSVGQVKALLIDSIGRLRVIAETAAVSVSYHDTVEPDDKAEIKSTPGSLHEIWGFNDGAETIYLQVHDSSGEPDEDTVPVLVFKLSPGAHFSWGLKGPRAFSNGIYWATSSTPGGYTPVAGTCVVGATYQ
jgi:hypothetical protein